MKILFCQKEFLVGRTQDGVIVINTRLDYANHAHFDSIKGAQIVLKAIEKNMLPNKEYFRVSCKRLLSKEQYEGMRSKSKPHYINVNKGVRK